MIINHSINPFLKFNVMPILDNEAIEYISLAANKTNETKELIRMFSNPHDFAIEYDLPITPYIEDKLNQIQSIRESFSFKCGNPINIKVLSFFNQVIIDGRYIHECVDDPQMVANNLGVPITSEVVDRIQEIQVSNLVDMSQIVSGCSFVPVVILIIIIGVLLTGDERHYVRTLVVDRSNMDKV